MRWILPQLLHFLTGRARYLPEFIPSSSWVVTAFRLYESVFGRRVGIRPEGYTAQDGTVYSFTLEHYLASIEAVLRERLAFRIVRVPELQVAGHRQNIGLSPYRFAVAFDAVEVYDTNTLTRAHTVTGSNPFIIGQVNGTATPLTATYNGTSAPNQIVQNMFSTIYGQLFTQGAPATGTHDFVFSGGAAYMGVISYSGCQSSSTPDSLVGGTGGNTSPFSLTTTSIADKCWAIGWMQSGNFPIAAGASTTSRATVDTFERWLDNNADITPAASVSLQITWSGSNPVGGIILTLAPATASTTIPLRALLGVVI